MRSFCRKSFPHYIYGKLYAPNVLSASLRSLLSPSSRSSFCLSWESYQNHSSIENAVDEHLQENQWCNCFPTPQQGSLQAATRAVAHAIEESILFEYQTYLKPKGFPPPFIIPDPDLRHRSDERSFRLL